MDKVLVACFVLTGVFTQCYCNYDIKGDHFTGGPQTMVDEWEEMIRKQDAEDMAAKYTEDCIYLHSVKGLLLGRDAVEQAYTKWFREETADADVTIIRVGMEKGFDWLLENVDFFNDEKELLYSSTALIIFKEVDGGRQIHLKSEIVN